MKGRLTIPLSVGLAGMVACTDVSTDPNAVVAIRFDGAAYPSIVLGDSLRDSLGNVQRLVATGLNYKNDPVAGAQFVFSSPDTTLKLFADGAVQALALTPASAPARVFATSGSLQSQPDSLLVVGRADSIKAVKQVDTAFFDPVAGGATADNRPSFQVFGDTAAGKPKTTIPGWLVSFRLRYHGTTIAISDTSFAFTFETAGAGTTAVRRQRTVDTTDASGMASHRLFVRSLSVAEDTVVMIATIRQRKPNTEPITDSVLVLVRPRPPSTIRDR